MRSLSLSLSERFKSTIKDIKLIEGLKNPRFPLQVIRMGTHNGWVSIHDLLTESTICGEDFCAGFACSSRLLEQALKSCSLMLLLALTLSIRSELRITLMRLVTRTLIVQSAVFKARIGAFYVGISKSFLAFEMSDFLF